MVMHHATSSRPRGPRVRHPHPLRTDRARRALALGATTSGRYASRSRKPDAELLSWAKSKGAQPMDVFSLREDEETGEEIYGDKIDETGGREEMMKDDK